ncbi:MAG: alpha/beta hydrolase family protein [Planctomycetaceae bacterium]
MRYLWLLLLATASPCPALAQQPETTGLSDSGPFKTEDSLEVGEEPSDDAKTCLTGLVWKKSAFTVQLEPGKNGSDFLIRFPSPKPVGNAVIDRVAVEWHMARERDGSKKQSALPIVIVHELGSNMAAGRTIAKTVSRVGFHAFMVQLPTYGERRVNRRARVTEMMQTMQQAIADARRARDAIAVLPTVDTSHIALQGTSLGGIIAASTGALDNGFDSVHLVLAGGDLFNLIKTGQRDTAYVRQALQRSGVTDDQLRQMTKAIEPTRIAHRLRAPHTWLYTGTSDTVIPAASSTALAKAAKLQEAHHKKLNANHYSGMLYLPWVVGDITTNIASLRKSE